LRKTLIVATACLVLASPLVAEQSASVPVTGEYGSALPSVDSAMQTFLRERGLAGCSLAIINKDRVVYARGYGFADIEKRVRFAPETVSRIASVSKPITATAIMRLVQEGRLRLEDKAFRVLGYQPLPAGAPTDPRLWEITVRQLLDHTAGFDRQVSGEWMCKHDELSKALGVPSPVPARLIVRYVMGKPLDVDPGSRYAYSNFGYCVLGRLIEKASGQTYEEYVKKAVLTPAGINGMRIADSRQSRPGEATYYDESNRMAFSVFAEDAGKRVPMPYGGNAIEPMDSHGGWTANVLDLSRFLLTLLRSNSPIISQKSLYRMVEGPRPLGWQVMRDERGSIGIQHGGSLEGSQALLYYGTDGLGVVLLFNNGLASDMYPNHALPRIRNALAGVAALTHDVLTSRK
jgi:N-acyl-D-amino-acid deacylase